MAPHENRSYNVGITRIPGDRKNKSGVYGSENGKDDVKVTSDSGAGGKKISGKVNGSGGGKIGNASGGKIPPLIFQKTPSLFKGKSEKTLLHL